MNSAIKGAESYKSIPFDTIDPEVYKTRSDRYKLVRTNYCVDRLPSKDMLRSGMGIHVLIGVLPAPTAEKKSVFVPCVKVN